MYVNVKNIKYNVSAKFVPFFFDREFKKNQLNVCHDLGEQIQRHLISLLSSDQRMNLVLTITTQKKKEI